MKGQWRLGTFIQEPGEKKKLLDFLFDQCKLVELSTTAPVMRIWSHGRIMINEDLNLVYVHATNMLYQ